MTQALAEHLEGVDQQQAAGVAVEPRGRTARDAVLAIEPQLKELLPKHLDSSAFVLVALNQLRTQPGLGACSSESVVSGIIRAAKLGLDLNPDRGQVFLIPRWNGRTRRDEASFQIGYRGLIELAGRGGITVRVREIHENDRFQFSDGLAPILIHEPVLDRDRGAVRAYFGIANFADGRQPEFLVMSKSEVENHRDRFASARNKQKKIVGPWVDHFDAMARKTVVIKLLGQLPLPVDLADSLSMDDADIDVPMDVRPPDLELPPAPPVEGGADQTPPVEPGASRGAPAPDENERDAPVADVPPAQATSNASVLPDADEDDPDRRDLAKYLLDEARQANPDDVKAWLDHEGIPNDSRRWTRAQIDQVIDWIHAEPETPTEPAS